MNPLLYNTSNGPYAVPQYPRTPSSLPVPLDTQLLQKTVEVLQNSTIAVETAKDPLSKFWAAYKKVASEHDNEMLDRCNGNMDIVLIFAGLFSAINTAFIIALQPNPADASNILLTQLIQITLNGTSAIPDPSATPPSVMGISSSEFWMQALAYVSLGLSLLAALGAVLGKQWLGYYKTKCFGRGSLEDRCKQRHRKFQKLQAWQFEHVLQSFPVLLQISVLLFGLFLGAAMWKQQHNISILIIVMTAFGALCHVLIVTISLISPDCPFQTPVSLAMRAIFDHFSGRAGSQKSTASASLSSASATSISTTTSSTTLSSIPSDSTTSAMQWILETSTDPDILRSVVELLPTMPKQPSINIMVLCAQVRDMFKACFDHCGVPIVEDSALAYGKALLYFSSNYLDANNMLRQTTQNWNIWERWRILYLPRVLEECRVSYHRMIKTHNQTSKSQFQANTRTALRMAVAAGIDEFANPDDPQLIWRGHFQFQSPLLDQFDWLMNCAEHFYAVGDIDVAGDSLLLLIGNIKDSESSSIVQQRITPFLNIDKGQPGSRRLLHIALRAACHAVDYRKHLPCDDDFAQAVLKAICPASLDVHHPDDSINNAIDLLNLGNWPKGSDIAHLSLPDIQLLVLRVLPAPTITYAPWWRALIRCMGADQPYHLRHAAIVRITEGAGKDLAIAPVSRVTRMHMPRDLSRIDLQSFEESLGNAVDWLRGLPEADENVVFAVESLRDMVHRKHQEGVEESSVPDIYVVSPSCGNSLASSSESFAVRPGSSGACQVDMPPRGFESVFDYSRVPLGFVPISFVPFSDDADSTSTTSQD